MSPRIFRGLGFSGLGLLVSGCLKFQVCNLRFKLYRLEILAATGLEEYTALQADCPSAGLLEGTVAQV